MILTNDLLSSKYTFDKIKFSVDQPTLEKAFSLYETGKITQVKENFNSYNASIIGTQPYQTSIDKNDFYYGSCTCYLGQNNTLCKHMVALAIYVVKNNQPLTKNDKNIIQNPTCSNKIGTISKIELLTIKRNITNALKYIKAYTGPSKNWFKYQSLLSEGCNRLSEIVSDLSINKTTAQILVNLILRLDKKLATGGVDDSDGEVGNFIEETVNVLHQFVKLNPECSNALLDLKNKKTLGIISSDK